MVITCPDPDCGRNFAGYNALKMHCFWKHNINFDIIKAYQFERCSVQIPIWMNNLLIIKKNRSEQVRNIVDNFLDKESLREIDKNEEGYVMVSLNFSKEKTRLMEEFIKKGRFLNKAVLLRAALFEHFSETKISKKKQKLDYLEKNGIQVIEEA